MPIRADLSARPTRGCFSNVREPGSWYETKLLSIVGTTAIPVHATARAELISE